MARKVDIKRSVPPYLLEFREFNAIYTALNKEFQLLQESREKVLDQFFIDTMCEESILRMEKMLNILPDPTKETLEFRRDRVKNRFLITPPFSVRYLRNQLDSAIGAGNYTLTVDNQNYTIYLESSALNQNWYEEIIFTINKVKPCNMIFTNKPLLTNDIAISEKQETFKIEYNYALGEWSLGEKTFADLINQKTIKDADKMSISQNFLNNITAFVDKKIYKVKVNDKTEITDFETKQVTENTLQIEYAVKKEQIENGIITNIKLLDSTDTVLSDSVVYVPITYDTLVKHTIKTKEGA